MSILVFVTVVLCTALVTAGLAYWMSRRHFENELGYQERIFSTELARLKRHANRADARLTRANQETERLRRRARHAEYVRFD
ncbi:hypothetical protein ACG74X_13390 [Marivita sp. S0852]|uniref:hypothetical protein n=1 Tax=Marivita sp. S0852 TaxID=3373893 RepID=UPI003981DED8